MDYKIDTLKKIAWLLFFCFLVFSGMVLEKTAMRRETVPTEKLAVRHTNILGTAASNGNPQVRPAIEWLNDEEFAVYRGCGTECETVYIFNLRQDGKQKLYYGVGHTWSPDKQYILAHHYAVQSGITVGDRYDNILFDLRREYPKEYVGTHKASWSPDSTKLALIIHQDEKTRMELFVFDAQKNFQKIVQKQIQTKEVNDLYWQDRKTLIYIDALENIFEENFF
ncbi:hypothetical protein CO051_04680 [Candidatus Roizmanbacteria bacterium CG_4_9_14_0_2_um_filter_39_13]|uniref:Dipeptidylpeptidase IV N-terminal domain-containing protein n=2 Tax=Candidatus Roizmaniibacteriota TaxID=1752723 RepID=A0A2M8EXS8_9BACT|nr:MAG: hypothetical protein COY15_05600 [Candidatus Roizmanbacteria bacterium CG_4_10_14_0_2_um_filter_39_12]PJC30952.1 MAG: hypothetical protein CO051_04680 [Candidatus Roizmanbacteria bacterium CG_4_9_14_0_2_um_filter_39_13]PJE61261.1 MAG: hypothetical protein COU87_05505 [Candidatus Roizmanbacteria bacterium CG10_big_fil_rev_8_21_14_0_10_39_12]